VSDTQWRWAEVNTLTQVSASDDGSVDLRKTFVSHCLAGREDCMILKRALVVFY